MWLSGDAVESQSREEFSCRKHRRLRNSWRNIPGTRMALSKGSLVFSFVSRSSEKCTYIRRYMKMLMWHYVTWRSKNFGNYRISLRSNKYEIILLLRGNILRIIRRFSPLFNSKYVLNFHLVTYLSNFLRHYIDIHIFALI